MSELPVLYRVGERFRETADTWTMRLEPAGDEVAGRFSPGQFAMLYAFGAGEAPISISAIGDDGALVHTVRAVGGVSAALCAAEPGTVVGVRGPFGTAWPVDGAAGGDLVLVAGGIGLAPLRPVIHALLSDRRRFRRVCLLYGGRTPEDLLYVDELARWSAGPDLFCAVSVDTADARWTGRVGVVTGAIPEAPFDPARATAMLCGPEVMMRFAADGLRDRGMASEAIWVSLERSMACGMGHCGHCQLGPLLICRDGAVLRLDEVEAIMRVTEL